MFTSESRFNLRAKWRNYKPLDAKLFREYNQYRPLGKKDLFCYVPFSGLTFCVNGELYACSYNREALLGSYPKQTLKEIWFSESAKKLRDHHSNNDLSYGCGYCKFFFDKRKFDDLKPTTYDKYAPEDSSALQYPRVLEFEISNICNLECQMCSGINSSSIRKNRDMLPPIRNYYDDAFIEQLKEFIPHIREARFMGGEPFLIPIHFQIWDLMLEINPDIEFFIVTNGTQWNDKVETLLNRGKFSISVSIDAISKDKLEMIRKNINAEEAFENINHFKEYCARQGTNLSLSFTIQKENWDELPAMIEYCNKLGASIFVSYLENPTKYSVTNFPVSKIKEILEQLSGHDFPSETENQRRNKHSYLAYLDFLKVFIESNKESDYQKLRSHQLIENAGELLLENFESEKPQIGSAAYSAVEVQGKINALSQHYSKTEMDKIYSLLLAINVNEAYTFLNRYSIEELISKCDESLRNYHFE